MFCIWQQKCGRHLGQHSTKRESWAGEPAMHTVGNMDVEKHSVRWQRSVDNLCVNMQLPKDIWKLCLQQGKTSQSILDFTDDVFYCLCRLIFSFRSFVHFTERKQKICLPSFNPSVLGDLGSEVVRGLKASPKQVSERARRASRSSGPASRQINHSMDRTKGFCRSETTASFQLMLGWNVRQLYLGRVEKENRGFIWHQAFLSQIPNKK